MLVFFLGSSINPEVLCPECITGVGLIDALDYGVFLGHWDWVELAVFGRGVLVGLEGA